MSQTEADEGAVGHIIGLLIGPKISQLGAGRAKIAHAIMLATYRIPALDNHANFGASLGRIRRWLELSKSRTTCDDAYSDLLMGAVEFGNLSALVHMEPDGATRSAMAAQLNGLMADLVVYSHALREACRPCRIR